MAYKIDKTDARLLYLLEQDARAPLSKIAKKIGVSQQAANYRMAGLLKSGLVERIAGLVEYRALGYTNYVALVRFANADESKIARFVEALKGRGKVNIIYRTTGRWDIVVGILAKDMWEASDEVSQIEKEFGEFIKERTMFAHIGRYYKGREYLLEKEHEGRKEKIVLKRKKITGGRVPLVELDETQVRILRCMEENARAPVVEIARKTGLNPETARLKVNELVEKGVFTGGFLLLDYGLFGRTLYRVFVKMRKLSPEKEAKLLSFAEKEKIVCSTTKIFGPWDYSFEAEVSGENELNAFLADLRNTFADVLMEYELLAVPEYSKWRTVV